MGNTFQKAQQEFCVILGCYSTVYPQMLTTTAIITNNNHNHYIFNWTLHELSVILNLWLDRVSSF